MHVPTGAGKTYAAYGGPLIEMIGRAAPTRQRAGIPPSLRDPVWRSFAGYRTASVRPIDDLRLGLTVESCGTGDTSATLRARQRRELPNILVTTPESLTLMLTWPECREALASLKCVILDEWHELISSRCGTQTELAIARLRLFSRIAARLGTLGDTPEPRRSHSPRGRA